MSFLKILPTLQIPDSEFDLSYARSSGPGGQNVNKVNSKSVLRWNIIKSPSLKEELRDRLALKLGSKINQEGEIIITSDRYRDQLRNKEDCFEKLKELILFAAKIKKIRKKTKPTRSSRLQKSKTKRKHAQKKNLRRKPGDFD